MVGIDPRGGESVLLGMRHALDGERGFAAARRAKKLHHLAARKSAAQRLIERAETGREEGRRRACRSLHARQPQQDGPLPLLFLLHRFEPRGNPSLTVGAPSQCGRFSD